MLWDGKFESLLPAKNVPIQSKYFKKQNPLLQGKNKTIKTPFLLIPEQSFSIFWRTLTSKWLLCFKHDNPSELLTNQYTIWLQIPFHNQNPNLITIISMTHNTSNFYDSFQQDIWLILMKALYFIPISARQVWFLCSFLWLFCFLDIEGI